MKKHFTVVFLLCLLIIACEKDHEDDAESCGCENSVTQSIEVGDTNATDLICFNEPGLTFFHQYDSNMLYSYATELLDIDCDGNYDLQFEINAYNTDSAHLLNGQLPNPMPSMTVKVLDDISIKTMIQSVPAGMGQTIQYTFVDTVGLGAIYTLVDELTAYASGAIVNMWTEAPSNVGPPEPSPWKTSSNRLFMLVSKGSTYSWIEFDNTDPVNPIITRLASAVLD